MNGEALSHRQTGLVHFWAQRALVVLGESGEMLHVGHRTDGDQMCC
jgi:hypothetical protein